MGYEKRDVRIRPVLGFMAALAVVFSLALWSMARLRDALTEERVSPNSMSADRVVPPAPRLELTPGTSLDALERSVAIELGSYGWIDAESDRVRIPIERAMELALEEGFPVR